MHWLDSCDDQVLLWYANSVYGGRCENISCSMLGGHHAHVSDVHTCQPGGTPVLACKLQATA